MTIAAAGVLLAAPAFAQGNSPWENAVIVLQQAVYEHHCPRSFPGCDRGVRPDFCLRGGRLQTRVLAGILFGVGMAIAAVNFLAWLFP